MKALISILLSICTAFATQAQVRISELPEATNTAGAQFVIIQGGATKRIGEVVVRTIPATSVMGLGPFATRTNLVGADIADFSNAVVAVAPPSTNASLLTSGTLPDARLSTNILRTSQLVASNISGLGPFATATNLIVAAVDGLQAALDGKLATNGTLPAANITGLGAFATLSSLASSNIADFNNAVVAVAPPTTNASLLTAGTIPDARISTNITRTSQLVASNISGLGPFATATNLSSTNISNFSNAVVAVSPPTTPTTNASLLTTGTLPDARLSTNVRNHIGLGWPALTNSNPSTALLGTAGGYVVAGTNTLNFTSPVTFTAPTTTVLRFQSPYKTVEFLATDEQLSVGYAAPRWSFGSDEAGFRVKYGTNDADWGAVLYLDKNDDGGIARTNLGLGPFATATNLSTANLSDFGDEVLAIISQPASAWKLATYNGDPTIATNEYGMGWDELGRFTLQTPVGAFQLYATGNPSVPTLYWPGKILSQSFEAITINGPVKASQVFGGTEGGTIAKDVIVPSLPAPLFGWTDSNAKDRGVPFTVMTNEGVGREYFDLTPGAYFPVAVVTNVEDGPNDMMGYYNTAEQVRSNLALGPFATATNISSSNISDFSNAVVAVSPPSTPTTNASALTIGTLDDARLSTNVVLKALLGPFATVTNLTSTNISDFSNAVTALATTTTNASLLTSGTLSDARLSTNVVFTTNAALTNARPVAWVGVPAATNSTGTFGDAALTNNFLYLCVGSNQWRRVLLGTW